MTAPRRPAVGDLVVLWGRVADTYLDGEVVKIELGQNAMPDTVYVPMEHFERIGEVRSDGG